MRLKLFFFCFLFLLNYSFAQVGIGTTTPNPSSILELSSSDKAFVLPRVANTAAIATPIDGMLIYDLSSNCIKSYENGAWTNCLSSGGSSTVEANCNTNGFLGSYTSGLTLSGCTFSVTITNNSFSTASLSFSTSDLVLSGITGITVASVSPASISLNGGQSQLVTYTLSGTPASTGTLTGTWTKLSLNCIKTQEIQDGDANFTLPQTEEVFSVFDAGLDIQGTIDNSSSKIIFSVPYSQGNGTINSYTSPWYTINAGMGEGGDNDQLRYSYSSLTGLTNSSGNLLVTVEVGNGTNGGLGDGILNVKKLLLSEVEAIITMPLMINGNNKGDLIINDVGSNYYTIIKNNLTSFTYPSWLLQCNTFTSFNAGAATMDAIVDWAADLFDTGALLFINQPGSTSISSANQLEYTISQTDGLNGIEGTSSLLNNKKYFTYMDNSKLAFNMWADVSSVTSIKWFSDSGIDGNSAIGSSSSITTSNGKYKAYYQYNAHVSNASDAFILHVFYVPVAQSSSISYSAVMNNLSFGNGSIIDDYSLILSWPTAGTVKNVFGVVFGTGGSITAGGPRRSIAEIEALINDYAQNVLP